MSIRREARAAWHPPRFAKLVAPDLVGSGIQTVAYTDDRWEGGGGVPQRMDLNRNYRVPVSGEPITHPNPWQQS